LLDMTSFTRITFALFCTVVFLPRTTFAQLYHPDVLNYQVNMDARAIFNDGFKAQTTLKCIKKNDEILILDLTNFSVDSVKIYNSLTTFSKSDSNLSINIPLLYSQIDTLIIDVFYHGIPFTDKTWGGFYRQGTYAFNLGIGFTSNPHNLGRAWFPCVDNFTDRATYNLSVTTGAGYTAVCGGLLTDEISNPDGSVTWGWQPSLRIRPIYGRLLCGLIMPCNVLKTDSAPTFLTVSDMLAYLSVLAPWSMLPTLPILFMR
jgi:aminopeptidase N